MSEEDGLEVVLGERRGVVGGCRGPLGVADEVPTSWVDETVEEVVDLVEGELAAGLLPADLGREGLGEGSESMVSEPGAEGSGGPARGPRTDDPCSAGTGSLPCTACKGPEDTTWLLVSLDKVPASSHTSFRRCKNN